MSKRKQEEVTKEATVAHPNYNKEVTEALQELAVAEKNKGVIGKYHVYLKAAGVLRAHPKKIESGEEARKLDGIGAKIAKKIQEILDTGMLGRVEKLRSDPRMQAISLVARVAGIGPKTAKRLVDVDGVRTLDDLRRIAHTLNRHQQIGLKHFEDFELRIPRAEVAALEAIIKEEAARIDPRIRCEAAGSYRRGLPESGDIDVLMSHPDYTDAQRELKETGNLIQKLVDRLAAHAVIVDVIATGASQFMGACRLPAPEGQPQNHVRRLDIKLFTIESYFCGLLHFTGSAEHNRQMSIAALSRKFQLNEYDLVPLGATGVRGQPFPITSEEDIFALLGLPYKTPEERNL
jgi:DNA polymerase beta